MSKARVVKSKFGGREREATLEVGKEYVIKPLNPRAKKNRGRRCLLMDFVTTEDGKHELAKVKYLDTNRPGRVDPSDLVPLG